MNTRHADGLKFLRKALNADKTDNCATLAVGNWIS
jgi:hypothetical protein